MLFLNQLDDAAFRWLIPGQRVELVTALIKSLPKQIRKNFVPAPDVARQAVAALEADFDPATDELEPSLELVLRRIRGQVIPPGSWNWDAVPPHLRVSFRVVDSRGKVLDEGKDLAALQERLAPATRRAIAESLGATPGTTAPAVQGEGRSEGKAAPRTARTAPRSSRRRHVPVGRPGGCRRGAGGFTEMSGLNGLDLRNGPAPGPGHRWRATPSPAIRPWWMREPPWRCGSSRPPSEQQEAMRGGVIRLLALKVPPPDRYVLEHLNNTEKLTFSQNPHGSVAALIADCALAAIDKLTPGRAAVGRGRRSRRSTRGPGGADRHRLHRHRRRRTHPGQHPPDRKAAQGHHEPGPDQRAQRRQEPAGAAGVPRFRGTHGLRPAQPAAALPRGDREAPREAARQRPAGRPAHGRGPGPRGRLRRRRVGAAARAAGRRRS